MTVSEIEELMFLYTESDTKMSSKKMNWDVVNDVNRNETVWNDADKQCEKKTFFKRTVPEFISDTEWCAWTGAISDFQTGEHADGGNTVTARLAERNWANVESTLR